jgi:hypothetical protein
MNHPSELIDELLKLHLKPTLKELGFKCKSSTFFRQNGELVEVISLQKSASNTAIEGKFTINLGVYWPQVQTILGSTLENLPPKEYDCTLRERLGSLFSQGGDFWWGIRQDSDIRSVCLDVAEKIRVFGLPWLKRAASLNEAVGMAQNREAVVFYTMKGECERAVASIEEAIAKNKHARPMYQSLATKLGLKLNSAL